MNEREVRTVTAAEQGRIGLVTGANQGLGLAVAAGLARAWGPAGAVYLTGRDRQRVEAAAASLARAGLRVLPEVCDVRDDDAVRDLAQRVAERHGGVDFVDSNAAAGLTPGVPFADQVDDFINTNNLGATRMIRWFGQRLRRGGRLLVTASDFGTLDNLPVHLHPRFSTDAMSLAGLDQVMRDYAASVRSGTAAEQGWPEWINIASKVGQVAAVRIYARTECERASRDGQLIAAVCPGLVDTRASRPWFTDMSQAQSPDAAAADIVKLATGPVEPRMYGELVQHGRTLPWNTTKGDRHEQD
jgi:NAD(P)-dependent dehydrogenase (short-subunit alcohol dehydrogenase family)